MVKKSFSFSDLIICKFMYDSRALLKHISAHTNLTFFRDFLDFIYFSSPSRLANSAMCVSVWRSKKGPPLMTLIL